VPDELLKCTGSARVLVGGIAGVAGPRQAPSQRRRPGQAGVSSGWDPPGTSLLRPSCRPACAPCGAGHDRDTSAQSPAEADTAFLSAASRRIAFRVASTALR